MTLRVLFLLSLLLLRQPRRAAGPAQARRRHPRGPDALRLPGALPRSVRRRTASAADRRRRVHDLRALQLLSPRSPARATPASSAARRRPCMASSPTTGSTSARSKMVYCVGDPTVTGVGTDGPPARCRRAISSARNFSDDDAAALPLQGHRHLHERPRRHPPRGQEAGRRVLVGIGQRQLHHQQLLPPRAARVGEAVQRPPSGGRISSGKPGAGCSIPSSTRGRRSPRRRRARRARKRRLSPHRRPPPRQRVSRTSCPPRLAISSCGNSPRPALEGEELGQGPQPDVFCRLVLLGRLLRAPLRPVFAGGTGRRPPARSRAGATLRLSR